MLFDCTGVRTSIFFTWYSDSLQLPIIYNSSTALCTNGAVTQVKINSSLKVCLLDIAKIIVNVWWWKADQGQNLDLENFQSAKPFFMTECPYNLALRWLCLSDLSLDIKEPVIGMIQLRPCYYGRMSRQFVTDKQVWNLELSSLQAESDLCELFNPLN